MTEDALRHDREPVGEVVYFHKLKGHDIPGDRYSEPFMTPETERDTSLCAELDRKIARQVFGQGHDDGGEIFLGDVYTAYEFGPSEEGEIPPVIDETTWVKLWRSFREGESDTRTSMEGFARRIGHGCRVVVSEDEEYAILLPLDRSKISFLN